ncbi:hypothetical protein TOT_020000569 [Theileria orientalis strain Shintoku]|uniref:Uncharacterized protein n=1 Tax=Theileria orientalis strain Shintoku TaxID=869250 RepID=J4D7R9_THEOR|nr:hypothetical protein TOT_020000569 [Theileria orientalis strain Shintoku]PVC51588.1 hypothetical protein MACL_00001387 [Theileria orientalis]BAM40310.1 hypothetical protein TOT_020000569 [Theileria orientalis strain Shintoku]|eukprot:XP_009690611.1 hypothetical protein TOT_020000569 [Theileria orientalis strain Shintoku]
MLSTNTLPLAAVAVTNTLLLKPVVNIIPISITRLLHNTN